MKKGRGGGVGGWECACGFLGLQFDGVLSFFAVSGDGSHVVETAVLVLLSVCERVGEEA